MRKKIIIDSFILLLIAFKCLVFQNGYLLLYLMGILIPFLFLIIERLISVNTYYLDYVKECFDEEKHEVIRFNDTISGKNITRSFLRKITPFTETIIIKMNEKGIHSIHAAPVL